MNALPHTFTDDDIREHCRYARAGSVVYLQIDNGGNMHIPDLAVVHISIHGRAWRVDRYKLHELIDAFKERERVNLQLAIRRWGVKT